MQKHARSIFSMSLALLFSAACTSATPTGAPTGATTSPPTTGAPQTSAPTSGSTPSAAPASLPPSTSAPETSSPAPGESPIASESPGAPLSPAPSQGVVPPPVPGPAWLAVEDQIGKNGLVSKDAALQTFSLAFGPLPGVDVPARDAGTIADGTMAVRWLVSFWDRITPAQQAAAIALVPDLAGLQTGSLDVARAAVQVPGGASGSAPLYAQNRTNDTYTKLAQSLVQEIGTHVQTPLNVGWVITARVGLPQQATSAMETGIMNAQGGYKGGTPAKCSILVAPWADNQSDEDVTAIMAHEAWHCYEGAVVGLARYYSQNPAPWIMEGEADWVAADLFPDAPASAGSWPNYLNKPDKPLFGRAYSSIGFYAHLAEAAIDPWGALVPIMEAKSNDDAFKASGATADAFLDTWASGYLRDSDRDAAWQISGPAVTADTPVPVGISLSNDGSIPESVAAYANEISRFSDVPEVLLIEMDGHSRISDGSGHDYLVGDFGAFCTLDTGCVCPDPIGEPPPLPLEGGAVALGISGGIKGAAGTLTGETLQDYCLPMTGTWDGTWANGPHFGDANGEFTLHAVQSKGGSFSGTIDVTGATCVSHGAVDGTIGEDGVQFGSVHGAHEVDFEGALQGTSMSGTWTTIACEYPIQIDGTWAATKRHK